MSHQPCVFSFPEFFFNFELFLEILEIIIILYTTREDDTIFSFEIGNCSVIKAWDVALRTICSLICGGCTSS